MAILNEAREAIESIVGAKYFSDDPVVMHAYCGGRMGHGKDLAIDREMNTVPACVVLHEPQKRSRP